MSYVKTAVYVLITAMVLSLVLTYASLMSVIHSSKDNTERVLRSYVIQNATIIYSSIKNGNMFTPSIDSNYFITEYSTDGGTFDCDGTYFYNKNNQGGYVYRITMPKVAFTQTNTLNLNCTYDLLIPVEFAGRSITELRIPIKIQTTFNLIN